MRKNKTIALVDINIKHKEAMYDSTKTKLIAEALYESARGSKHFYEALDFLARIYPFEYGEEFENLKRKYE